MSGETRDFFFFNNDHFLLNNTTHDSNSSIGFSFLTNNSSSSLSNSSQSASAHHDHHDPLIARFDDHPPFMSFADTLQVGSTTDYNSLSRAFGLISPNSPINNHPNSLDQHVQLEQKPAPVTPPNSSSVSNSSSSHEVGGEDHDESNKTNITKSKEINHHQLKAGSSEEGADSSKKVMIKKANKKVEKERQQRFAFVTKSEVDNLEDGYRWRKYGQKAVKNSPFPRSYYRCTTQKCIVKKRVERSYEDQSTVITTYEGQHNHHIPSTLRGAVAGLMMQPSMHMGQIGGGSTMMSFPYDQSFIEQMAPLYLNSSSSSSTYNTIGSGSQNGLISAPLLQQIHHQLTDYGLLQDMVPSMILKHDDQPPHN
ncbi:WRKY transcription factor 71-like [Impatiens glandulifera]|uniref:WRKY transcription factor 71-like n=1 Tax=Impatiens glandulifera TaxID=253017 RepID=UPI001FB08D34|nr:WRKY transcription factor 71-like [Impatiens glandulifera]